MEIKFFKTHNLAKLPTVAHPELGTGDTGYDIYTVEEVTIPRIQNTFQEEFIPWAIVPTGLQVAGITPCYWFKIEAKSGLGFKHGIWPHPGIIDNSYRGDLSIKVYNLGNKDYTFHVGDKIAQIVIYPLIHAKIEWANETQPTTRGGSGFGSTGK